MKRPMRLYRPSEYRCLKCREYIVQVEEGWQHVRNDPPVSKWHQARPR